MTAAERRAKILRILRGSEEPVSAGRLAAELEVSRQIIVGDVALLRAGGEQINATPRGYRMESGTRSGPIVRRIACRHTAEQMEAELNAVVDHGCTVLDVIVEHPVYGELTGPLQISNRYEVSRFIEQVAACSAQPLSNLTEGIHLHTISCPSEAAFARVCAKLRELGCLLEESSED